MINWTASWIGLLQDPTPTPANTWLAFRRTINLQNRPRRTVARIATDSKYWLYINGQLSVFEGALKRGPTPTGTWYDTVDLTDQLREGDNTIAILVWHFGKEGYCHVNSGKAALLFELDADAQGAAVRSDSNWRVSNHPAYQNTDSPHPNYRLPESNIRFDARHDLIGWEQPGFDDSAWPQAQTLARPPHGPWGKLYERTIPQWLDRGIEDFTHIECQPLPDGSQLYIGTLPYNAQVTPCLDVTGPAGKHIDLRMDNYIGGSEPNIRAEYITREGRQTHESLGWMNGHAVHALIPAGIEVHRFAYRETGYATEQTGFFHCDDDRLNQLWQKSARTLYVNIRDTMFDSPDRERAQWWGDTVLEMTQGFYGFDRRIDKLSQKAILELAAWQRDDNVLFSPIPAGNYRDELPQQMLASVGWYGFWSYYWFTADAETIAPVYPAVASYMQLWSLDHNGLAEHREGDWDWADWGDNIDAPLLDQAWYALALHGQANMAKLIGKHEDLPLIEHRLKSLKDNFARVYWDGEGFRSPEHQNEPHDDRGQALAYLAGLTSPEHQQAIHHILTTHNDASPYMEKYVLEALFRMGATDDALHRMNRRYREMVESPITTLWEGWELNTEKYGGGTYNHAWSGGPLELLSRFVAGLEPTEPAWKTFTFRPQLGSLNHVTATIPIEPEPIRTTITRDRKNLSATLLIPDGHVATINPTHPLGETSLTAGRWQLTTQTNDDHTSEPVWTAHRENS
ncbi:alpha-L-rhamnosidase N-terminal domain-containing protein [Mucisphaera sp.]|uniref:alpha-L-rhamnosidase-related protein n=1 Tax=Mucisphaera sp. TaxID=2913024 RepID=UPI003D0DB332